ncbi:MAG: PhoH family protein, partial [Gallicola sp.]|nr:PhoH family protein [Gallicola sp.]
RIIKKQPLTDQQLNYTIDSVLIGKGEELEKLLVEPISYTASGKILRAKTLGQYKYIDAIKKNDIVFGIGPAGTGKTYLAMAMAIKAFKNNEVRRIILTRPAVEAGESLGFLPGDLQEKIDPYLRPLYDALFDILGFENYQRLVEKGLIEVAPLAYMRGRTLDDSYIILDEAQNTTSQQMKMFLTRIGYGSKAVITGDITQVDLPRGKKSGLVSASNILKDIKGIEFMTFRKEDVVRHPLVQRIIEAYEKDDK